MALNTLQQRIHRARTEEIMDELYDETEQFYVDGAISYNVAVAFWRELNKRFWNAHRTLTQNYPFFDGILGGGDEFTFDSTASKFDSDVLTWDMDHSFLLTEDGDGFLLEDDSGKIILE